MDITENIEKNLLFEYIIYRLEYWKRKIGTNKVPPFTKLRLQKILFLICAWNVSIESPKLLSVFNRFYALPYGPVEMDIYEAMKVENSFRHICFRGNECIYNTLEESMFASLSKEKKEYVDAAIETFISNKREYLTMPVFDLVDLTHKWTVWRLSMEVAKFLNSKKEEMSTVEICNSINKEF